MLSFPFQRGQFVVVILHTPRERLWGRLLGLEQPGLAIRGFDLQPWEEVLSLVRSGQGDQVSLATRFIPLHRIETMYVDEAGNGMPSHATTFKERTGMDPDHFLADPEPARRRRKP